MIVSDARVWDKIELGINASSGARKWVDVFVYDDYSKCFAELRKHYDQILGTHLAQDSVTLYDINFVKSTAIILGNEHEGLTEEALSYIDGNFIIPQVGMVQSLNISVAFAVSAYEALRQRSEADLFNNETLSEKQEVLHQDYRQRNFIQHRGDRANIVK
ncbi:UNVERIFIED_CONTAM: hypothetical protein GTU68_028624 [Idotea baltica]|nr:hypothetical protein [Idotea baltica]